MINGENEMRLRIKLLTEHARAPKRATERSAGYDLYSAEEKEIAARGKALIKTNIAIAVPEGTYGRIAPRSSLAYHHHIDVAAGVIDADYRGDVGVLLFNHSPDLPFVVHRGDRIAQLILERIVTPSVEVVDELDSTLRGDGAYGSTGK